MLFKLEDSSFYEFVGKPATLTLPPATLGAYNQWLNANRPVEGDKLDETGRVYRATLAIGQLEVEGLNALDLDPTNEDLNMSLVQWVNECVNRAFGPHLLVGETLPALQLRRLTSPLTKNIFEPAHFQNVLPALANYTGQVEFLGVLTQQAYRDYHKSIQVLPKVDPRHPDNSVLMRQFRAGLKMVKKWGINTAEGEAVSWSTVTLEEGKNLPLELASFLVEAADTYLFKRLNLKKSLWMSTPTA